MGCAVCPTSEVDPASKGGLEQQEHLRTDELELAHQLLPSIA